MTISLEVGIQLENGNPVYLNRNDRYFGSLVLGPIGSGKTAFLLKGIHQDLKEMKKNENNEVTNGLSLFEPSGDVCNRVKNLAENEEIRHITYFNPSNSDSCKINPLHGDFSTVLKAFIDMLESYFKGLDTFYAETQKDALKQLLFVSKYSGEHEVGLHLVKYCLQNPKYFVNLAMRAIGLLNAEESPFVEFEEKEKVILIKGLKRWMKDNISLTIDNHEVVYQFKHSNLYIGLLILLEDLQTNPYVGNVFTTQNEESFSFEDHVNKGGLMLVSTSMAELGEWGTMVGKYFLSRLESAIYNRSITNDTPTHQITMDESQYFLYEDFIGFLALERKFKVSTTLALQTLTLIKNQFGENMLQLLFANLRNRFIFGGVAVYDARLFTSMVGVSELEKMNITTRDLIIQDFLICTASLVQNGVPMPVKQFKIRFLD